MFSLNIRRCLHDDVFRQKPRHLSPFRPFVYTNTMKTHLKTETFENGDLSGDLENGARENARVNAKNECLVNTEAIVS